MIMLAFYKGKGTWVDRVIRVFTWSKFSHVEYIQDHSLVDDQGRHQCWSSSARDGGVRMKNIHVAGGQWDLCPLFYIDDELELFFACKRGCKYDYFGILFSQIFRLKKHDQDKWFCSEIIASALGFLNPETLSPVDLFRAVMGKNEDYLQCKTSGDQDV